MRTRSRVDGLILASTPATTLWTPRGGRS